MFMFLQEMYKNDIGNASLFQKSLVTSSTLPKALVDV